MNNNKPRPKLLKSQALVRFQHCDPLGHLNNSLYLDYFLNAREDQLLYHYDVNLMTYAQTQGKGWVIASHNIKYIRPVITMDTLEITTCVKDYTSKSITVLFEMYKGDTLCSTMTTTFVHIDVKTGKPTEHSQEWMEFFNEVVIRESSN